MTEFSRHDIAMNLFFQLIGWSQKITAINTVGIYLRAAEKKKIFDLSPR